MDIQKFLDAFASSFSRNGARPVAISFPAFFDEVMTEVRGMTTPSELLLLNLAARALPEDEVYLEAGTNRGATIIGASYEVDRDFVTVDDYSWFSSTYDVARQNLAKYGRTRVEAIKGSIWQVLRDWPSHRKVGVWFYDGNHRFVDQWRALSLGEHVLADEALVIVDDISWPGVAAASDAFVATHPRFEEIVRVEDDAEQSWASGVVVYRYRRSAPAGSRAAAISAYVTGAVKHTARHPVPILKGSAHSAYLHLPESLRTRLRRVRVKSDSSST